MTKKKLLKSRQGILLVLPSCLFILLFIVYPVVETIILSFHDSATNEIGLSNYVEFFTTKSYYTSVFYTLGIVIKTLIINVAVSLSIALYVRFNDNKLSNFIASALPLPRLIPGIVAIYAFMTVIKNQGAIQKIVFSIFGIVFKPDILHTPESIILMNLWFNVPFATMLLSAALGGINDSIIESARDVGANFFKIFKDIIIPHIFNTILLVCTFCFMGNIGEFTTPFLMGETKVKMLGVVLFNEFSVLYNPNMASTVSVVLFLMSSSVAAYYIYANLKTEI